jgi:hypothetical protein
MSERQCFRPPMYVHLNIIYRLETCTVVCGGTDAGVEWDGCEEDGSGLRGGPWAGKTLCLVLGQRTRPKR